MGHVKFSVHALKETHHEALRSAFPAELVSGAIACVERRSGHVYCVLVDDQPVGLAILTVDGELMVYIHPQHQRKGFGTEALTNIIRRARNAGVTNLHAKARKDTGGAALATKAGMQLIKEENGEVFFDMPLSGRETR